MRSPFVDGGWRQRWHGEAAQPLVIGTFHGQNGILAPLKKAGVEIRNSLKVFQRPVDKPAIAEHGAAIFISCQKNRIVEFALPWARFWKTLPEWRCAGREEILEVKVDGLFAGGGHGQAPFGLRCGLALRWRLVPGVSAGKLYSFILVRPVAIGS